MVESVRQPVGQVHGPVTVVVGTDWPTQEHGQVTWSRIIHCGTAQNDSPGGGGKVQEGGSVATVIVGQTS